MTDLLKHLNEVNTVKIHDVHEDIFESYGRIIHGYDTSEMIGFMEEKTEIPESGNIYVPSVKELEAFPVFEKMEQVLYGSMPLQAGYCNGRNTTYNGFEYHKGSEINIAVTDFMLVLSHIWKIKNLTITADEAEVFFVKKGTMLEMYETTLHLSPCCVTKEGFKDIVILPKGTNTPLNEEEKAAREMCRDAESKLLLQRNKWVLAHPEREPLVRQGAYCGFIGENRELKY